MLIRIDPSSGEPLYRQIADQVKVAIARGELPPGQRLPVARELAGSLGVNLETVLRAFGELREAGLVEVRRRRGVTVLAASDPTGLKELAKGFVQEARRRGISDPEIRTFVEEAL